jgi:hypothetical protein
LVINVQVGDPPIQRHEKGSVPRLTRLDYAFRQHGTTAIVSVLRSFAFKHAMLKRMK